MRRAAIGALLVTVGLGTVSGLLFLAAFQLRVEWFIEPAPMVAAGPTSAELLRWAAAADLFSYYLATGVVAYVLWTVLRPHGRVLADASALGAFGYVLAGGAAASALAMVGPMLMHEHARAGADQAATALAFAILAEVVFGAIWQFLDPIFLAVWWFGIGALVRTDQPGFARLSLGLATLATVGAGFTLLDVGPVRLAGAGLLFVLWVAWSVWLLVLVWRRRPPFALLSS
jgi:hypothetical protein